MPALKSHIDVPYINIMMLMKVVHFLFNSVMHVVRGQCTIMLDTRKRL